MTILIGILLIIFGISIIDLTIDEPRFPNERTHITPFLFGGFFIFLGIIAIFCSE